MGMPGDEIVQGFSNGLSGDFNHWLFPGVRAQRRGNQDFDGHMIPFMGVGLQGLVY
jgi:hypothetical protein